LGGLIARYAIALLYENETATQTDFHEEYEKDVDDACKNQPTGGKIAGLEPMNFITFATPHLGTRSHKQVMFKFCTGFYFARSQPVGL
jgi:E3 ubiquitin-protein ligase FANCL